MSKYFFGYLVCLVLTGTALADEVEVTNAWVHASVQGQDTASIHLVITSKGDAELVGLASGTAQNGEIHSTPKDEEKQPTKLYLPAETPVAFGENGNRLILTGLRRPLAAGHKLPFALTVKFPNGKPEYSEFWRLSNRSRQMRK